MNYPKYEPLPRLTALKNSKGVVSIYPIGGTVYKNGNIVMVDKASGYTTVVHKEGIDLPGAKSFETMIQDCLDRGMVIVNGKLDQEIIERLGVKQYVARILRKKP